MLKVNYVGNMLKTFLLALSLLFCVSSFSESDSLAPKTQKQKRAEDTGTVFSSGGIFGGSSKASAGEVSLINMNLWQASLDVIASMPIEVSDARGGVLSTSWYEDPDNLGEKYRVNVLVKSIDLAPHAIQVTIFKQTINKDGSWKNIKTSSKLSEDMEDKILTRARELKLSNKHSQG